MTVCVAATCDDGKTLILVADKMVGIGYIEAELKVSKLRELGKNWWALFAGDDISSVFDVIDGARVKISIKRDQARLGADSPTPVDMVSAAVKESYEEIQQRQAEALYLKPIGWDIATFNAAGHANLPDFGEIKARIAGYHLPIELLIAGFGTNGTAYVLSLTGAEGSVVRRHDVPGFYAIGSGGVGAMYMLYYRELSYKTQAREALYYAMEAKLFGEQASGVGEDTDMYVATADGNFRPISEDSIESKLVAVWNRLRPKWIGKHSRPILNFNP
jgi:20S proteasome alpha/beta subunit